MIGASATATAAARASATFNVGDQNVSLNAKITSPAGVVNEGFETFTILAGTTVIGVPVTVNVSAGSGRRRLCPARRARPPACTLSRLSTTARLISWATPTPANP